MIFLIIPLLLFGFITKHSKLKDYYLPDEIVQAKIKILFPNEKNLTILLPDRFEYNLTHPNEWTYILNVKFKAKENEEIILGTESNMTALKLPVKIKNIALPQNFSNLYSPYLKISNIVASEYDKTHNILSFSMQAKNLKYFSLIDDENLTLISNNLANYYIILPKKFKKLIFFYYNTKENSFKKVEIPIKIKHEKVSTQTDLNPEKETIFTPINILILGVITFLMLIFFIYQKIYLLIPPAILAAYFIYKIFPTSTVTLPPYTNIYILPTKSTIFYTTKKYTKVKLLKKGKKYSKIEIENKVGWVKNEAIK